MLDKSVVCPVLLGRASQLDAVGRLIEQVRAGRGQIVLVSGEAGIGKSRLVAEMSARLDRAEWISLQGNCFELDRAFPYAALLDLLRSHFAMLSPSDIVNELGLSAYTFAKLLPDFASQLPTLAPLPWHEPEQEKRLIFETLAQYLQRLASQRPLFLLFEDLHWGDDTTLEFLLYLVRHIALHPIMLMLTYRSDEIPPNLSHFLAMLARQQRTTEFVLPRLTRHQVDSMLRIIFALGRRVRSEFLEAIYGLTEGNPFFIEEILKSLMVTGDIFYTDVGWERKPIGDLQIPRSVRDAVQRRTMSLSQPTRDILAIAAVIGQRFDFTVIQRLTQQSENELLQAIKELIMAQLVVEISADEFAFRHALTRQAVYLQLLARERQAFHRAIGKVLEQLYSETLDMHLSELAYHFDEGRMWEKALTYAQRAGELAQSLYAPRTAVEQFTRAVAAARHFMPAPPHLYRARGQAHETLGDFEEARNDYEAALKVAGASGDLHALWQALLDLGLLWASRDYTRTGDYYQQALILARQSEDPSTYAHTLNRVGNWRTNIGEPGDAFAHHRQALDIFERLNEQHGIAQTLDHMGMAGSQFGDRQVGEYLQRAVAIFRTLDDRYGLIMSLAMLGLWLTPFRATGIPDVSEHEMALELAREIGWRAGEAYVLLQQGLSQRIRGEYTRAWKLTQLGISIAEEIEHRQWMTLGQIALGSLYLDMLALPLARQHLEQALAQAKEMGSLIWIPTTTAALAATYLAQGEFELAAAVLDPIMTAGDPQTRVHRACWSARAQLALRQGKPEMALHITDQLIASEHLDAMTWLEWPTLHPQQVRGETLAALRQIADAEAALCTVRDEAISQGYLPRLWPIHISLGKFYVGQKNSESAQQEFEAARVLIEKLGATMPDEALRQSFRHNALAMIPASPPLSARQTAKREFGGLSERERNVARLVTQGKSNPEIAQTLVLSKRTVETHISNIMSKLGFDRRAQIIAWVVANGMPNKE